MEVVGVVLSVSLELLLKKLASDDLWKYARREKIETELNRWKENLNKINKVLDDAEKKQIDDMEIRKWLVGLRDLAYDVDDLLDDFNYEMTRRQLMGMAASGSGSKVRKFLMVPSCCNNFCPRQNKRRVEMGSKMEDITQRLEKISGQTGDLDLKKLKEVIEEGSGAASDQWRPTPPFSGHEAGVFGRDEDKEKIIAMLLNSPHDDAQQQGGIPNPNRKLSVVSIVAMGGMGKTTLAGLVYKKVQTFQHFSEKAWVCVSDPFNLKTVTGQILSCIDPSSIKDLPLHQLQEALNNRLEGKKFLIVLDDVWTEVYDDWNSLRSPLLNGAPGSKILVTTRSRKVATMMGGDECLHELNLLSEDDCRRVFEEHALQHRNVDDRQTLEPIGWEIVKKCGGSPLAATALGGLLCNEREVSKWNRIRDSKILDLPADECKILPALTLSYTCLPSYLKRCFAYCAIFPKDYQFDKEELIRLWMAEGLLNQPSKDDKREMEDVGSYYFDELLSRSFFQTLSNSKKSQYVMHDLINDLANSIAKDTCLHLDDKLKNALPLCPISQTIRHSSVTRDQYETFDKFERFRNKDNLRTFIILPIGVNRLPISYISNKVVLELIPRMRHIRVLSLIGYNVSEIPDSFGELKHLRYLNLSFTSITCLPKSIGNLYNLQTLILSHCRSLIGLPISMRTLISLRCLDIRGVYQLIELPAEIRKLEHLQILSNLIVGGSNSNTSLSIEDLTSMPPLRGKPRISIMENVAGVQDVSKGDVKLISNLEGLEIKWEPESNDDDSAESVLGFLEPNVNLKKLKVQSYSASRFPRWVNDVAKFTKMVKLTLRDCRKCEYLPCLGMLPSLEWLHIQGMDGVKGVGAEFCGQPSQSPSFNALESLCFAEMPNWEEWSSSVSSFPRLRELTIRRCPKFVNKLPACLPSLKELWITKSPNFESPLLGLQSLTELDVDECNVEVLSSGSDLTSLTRLTISGISRLINLQEGFVGFLGALQDLRISGCPKMISPWEDELGLENLHDRLGSGGRDGHELESLGLGLGCNLKSLYISNCSRLERLPHGWHLVLPCLKQLIIVKCPKVVSFPDGFPPVLRDVTLENCKGLKHLPGGMMMTTRGNGNNINSSSCRLECLEIKECSSLTCFPKGQLPTTLKQLILDGCQKLNSLPEVMMIGGTGGISCSLEHLEIQECPSLTCFSNGSFPATLKKLIIKWCTKLDCLPDGMMCSNNTSTGAEDQGICCSQLEELEIGFCSSLTCFPNGRLPTTLKQLHIYSCEKLASLPEGIMQQHQSIHIPCLEILHLRFCSSLTSFPQGSFPSTLRKLELVENTQIESISDEIMFHHSTTVHNCSLLQHLSIRNDSNLRILPAASLYNLTSLSIMYCEKLEFEHNQFENLTRLTSLAIQECKNIKRPLSQWGLANLPSLQSLKIEGLFSDAVSFSDTTTGHHHHQCCSNNLPPTLTFLEISSFDKLESLASISLQTLTSLRSLHIRKCPKLRSILPREGVFPHTLTYLEIWGCPLLKESYSGEKGEHWPRVAHIPLVDIGYSGDKFSSW